MTRKDYELIAAAIKRQREVWAKMPYSGAAGETALGELAEDLAGELKAANNAFNVTKFLRACGVS